MANNTASKWVRRWPSRWEQWLSTGDWTSKPSFFGLSTGRTGTTTLEYALNLVPEVAAFHEPGPRTKATYYHAYRDVYAHPEVVRDYFVQHRRKAILAIQRRGQIYAETNNFQFACPVVAHTLPKSVFLFFHRHAAEYVRSGMRRKWYDGHPWDAMRLTPRPDDPWHDEWEEWGAFEKICWFWQAANRLFYETVSSLPEPRRLTVGFQDLIQSKGESLLPIYGRLGVSQPPLEELHEVYSQPHNEQVSGDFPGYRSWSGPQKATLKRIAGEMMEILGYE